MNPRLLFPNTLLPKRYVVEQLLSSTAMIYADHPVYTYAPDDEETKIQIAPTYGNTNRSDQKPKMLFQGGSYEFSLQDTLDKNFSEELLDLQGQFRGKRHIKRIRMMVMVMVQSFLEEESSDIADEFAMLCATQAAHVYANANVNIVEIEISETNVLEQDNKTFQTIVSMKVESMIQVDDLPIPNGPIDFAPDVEIPSTGNRPPGVEVFFKSRRRE